MSELTEKLKHLHPDMDGTEKEIIATILEDAIQRDYTVSVYDGVSYVVNKSSDMEHVFQEMGGTASDILLFRDKHGEKIGKVLIIYGLGCDITVDYTDLPLMDELLARALELYQ